MQKGCDCPGATNLTDIPGSDCPFDIKQIQKIVFQRRGFNFTTGQIELLANWTPLKTATDDTKIVTTPFIGGNPIITAGEAITNGGGDNSTLNGEEEVTGSNPSVFTADFKSLTPEQEKAMKTLICEKKLSAYLLNEENKIIASNEGLGAGEYKALDVSAFFIGDKDNQGFATNDINKVRFSLKAGWSENIVKISATDFSPLVDL